MRAGSLGAPCEFGAPVLASLADRGTAETDTANAGRATIRALDDKWLRRGSVHGAVKADWLQFEVVDAVVARVLVFVMDLAVRGNGAVMLLPHPSVLIHFSPARIGGDVAVRSFAPLHTASPGLRSASLVHPCRVNIGCCAVPIKHEPSLNPTRPTVCSAYFVLVTMHGPARVTT